MLGIGERMAMRVQERRVPQAAEQMAGAVGVPREDERVEQRIAEAAGDGSRGMENQRPRRDDRRRAEGENVQRCPAA